MDELLEKAFLAGFDAGLTRATALFEKKPGDAPDCRAALVAFMKRLKGDD